jgi:hypothetical protein
MAYKQRWLDYFEVLDADGSGFIDPGDLKYATQVFIRINLLLLLLFIFVSFSNTQVFVKLMGKPEDSPEVQGGAAAYRQFYLFLAIFISLFYHFYLFIYLFYIKHHLICLKLRGSHPTV